MNLTDLLPECLTGLLITLKLMILSLAIGLGLALIFTLLSETNRAYFKAPVNALVFMIRGTPLLVQIFIIYYGSGQWAWLHHTFLWEVLKRPFGCAVLALALNTGAYTSVLLRGAIHSIPSGEIEACQALGFSRWQMISRIILPRAFRIALPAYSNEVIMILKGTSLASTITLMDLMGVTTHWIAMTYQTIPLLIVAGVIYLALNGIIIGIFRLVERKLAFGQVVKI